MVVVLAEMCEVDIAVELQFWQHYIKQAHEFLLLPRVLLLDPEVGIC
jgi:hypothetical protein